MEESTETTAQVALKIPDKVWKVIIPFVGYVIFLGTQQHAQAARQDDTEATLAKILEVQYTFAIDMNTVKITIANYESLTEMASRIEKLLDQLEDGT